MGYEDDAHVAALLKAAVPDTSRGSCWRTRRKRARSLYSTASIKLRTSRRGRVFGDTTTGPPSVRGRPRSVQHLFHGGSFFIVAKNKTKERHFEKGERARFSVFRWIVS